jgi:hypothetical protein
MRFTVFLAALLGLVPPASESAEGQAAPARPEYSVLTPALETQIKVAAGLSAANLVPGANVFKDLATRENSLKLQKLAVEERFDPAQRLADRLVEALAEAGHSAAYEPIPRKAPGSKQSLSRSDLPEQPKGELILDVTIRMICLCRGDSYFDFSPAFSLAWRVLDSRGGIVEPTRIMTYVHDDGPTPASKASRRSDRQEAAAAESRYPTVAVSASCNFKDVDDGLSNPTLLWGCFGEAMDVAVDRLVLDLEVTRAGELPVTVSGDNPSGISTR